MKRIFLMRLRLCSFRGSFLRKGERLEYEQQREHWDWITTICTYVAFVWEQTLAERRGKDTGVSIGFFSPCIMHNQPPSFLFLHEFIL